MSLKRVLNDCLREAAFMGVARVQPRIRRTIPHDPGAFTEGLTFANGILFESTGGYNISSLRQIDPMSGRIIKTVSIDDDFAEGIALIDGYLYQLAWKSGRVRIYDPASLKCVGEARTDQEAWGLASMADALVMSDGTNVLQVRDSRMGVSRRIRVLSNALPVRHLNDLTYNGRSIIANVWPTSELVEIEPAAGRVISIVDCRSLADREQPRDRYAVLNGIAHDPESGGYYLTGKNWQTLFEVDLPLTP